MVGGDRLENLFFFAQGIGKIDVHREMIANIRRVRDLTFNIIYVLIIENQNQRKMQITIKEVGQQVLLTLATIAGIVMGVYFIARIF
jgi:hypothetical protein